MVEVNDVGFGVVLDLSFYILIIMWVDVFNMFFGYDLGNVVFNFLLSYKSGILIIVGMEFIVFLWGMLVDKVGNLIVF